MDEFLFLINQMLHVTEFLGPKLSLGL